ncbi:fasciclin-2-like [Tachypleus tridentatus]|uniref:fasciclin-2-like n=1 Tax=Tachypleus tridentatus TaxID=6853 RepID=UPI003FD46BAC
MKFARPKIWRELTDHSSNCYICMVDPSKRRAGKNVSAIIYLGIPLFIVPVPHCPELPVPTSPERDQPSSEESIKSEEEEDVENSDYNFRGSAEYGSIYKTMMMNSRWLDKEDVRIQLKAVESPSRFREQITHLQAQLNVTLIYRWMDRDFSKADPCGDTNSFSALCIVIVFRLEHKLITGTTNTQYVDACKELIDYRVARCFAEEPENRAELIIQPKGNSQSRPARESFAITCTGKSDNNEYFSDMEWKDPSGNTLVSSENNQDIEVRKTSESILSLVFVNPRTKDSGRYTCIASYDNSERLETYVQITFFHDITWNDCSEKQSLIVNKPGKLLCIVSANPSPQVSWVKLEGTKDIELDKTHITVESDGIFMSKVQESDGGKYRIQAMVTETGRFKHRDINLEVLIPPNITEFQEKTQAIEDNGLVLKCVASSANPDPLYSWFDKNDHQIQTEGRFLVDKTLGTLTIQKAKKEDAGLYSCIAQNEAGQDKKQLQLTVLSKPKILQFEKKNTVEGKSTSLECRVSGVPHPEVSLRKEGSHEKLESGGRMIVESFQEKEITSLKMTISQVMREDDGLYFCHAENMAGKVEKAGHLTVECKISSVFEDIVSFVVLTRHSTIFPCISFCLFK